MSRWIRTRQPSVYVRHQQACPAVSNDTARCRCTPSFYAQARSKTTKKIVKSPTFHDINEAAGWLVDFKRGRLEEAPAGLRTPTFGEIAEQCLEACERGAYRNRRGDDWSPKTLESYRGALRREVRPLYWDTPADRIDAPDWQALVDRLHRRGLSTNSILGVVTPVKTVYRYACSPARRLLKTNPTVGLELPAPNEKRRDRITTPTEAGELLAALELRDRVPFALALYAGLRRREIRPATWAWIDFDRGIVDVRESKTKNGIRVVPMAGPLRSILLEWRMACGNPAPDQRVVFGRYRGMLNADRLVERADAAWAKKGLTPIRLHECRHTYASFLIAAGVNAKAISSYMGHSSISITFDRYGHLMPGNEAEAAEMLNDYLTRRTA